jgi:hypothetical protein
MILPMPPPNGSESGSRSLFGGRGICAFYG